MRKGGGWTRHTCELGGVDRLEHLREMSRADWSTIARASTSNSSTSTSEAMRKGKEGGRRCYSESSRSPRRNRDLLQLYRPGLRGPAPVRRPTRGTLFPTRKAPCQLRHSRRRCPPRSALAPQPRSRYTPCSPLLAQLSASALSALHYALSPPFLPALLQPIPSSANTILRILLFNRSGLTTANIFQGILA